MSDRIIVRDKKGKVVGWFTVRTVREAPERPDQTDLGASDDRPLGPDNPLYYSASC
jgi:hypothetical protein